MKKQYLYTGGYKTPIGCYLWENETLTLQSETPCLNPSFLTMHPKQSVLYAASEYMDAVRVSAYEKNTVTGQLVYLNEAKTDGAGLCHIVASEKALYGATYNAGQVVAFALDAKGWIGACISKIQHVGSGEHRRQEKAHAHQVVLAPDKKRLIAVDLGTNQLYAYKIAEDGSLLETDVVVTLMPQGEGPRHMVFAKNGVDAYLITELGNKVLHLRYHDGAFAVQEQIALLSEYGQSDIAAEIAFLPNSSYLYAGVRGVDKLFVLQIDEVTGALVMRGSFPSEGASPRMFSFSEDGAYLFSANQQGNSVTVFAMHADGAIPPKYCLQQTVDNATFAEIF